MATIDDGGPAFPTEVTDTVTAPDGQPFQRVSWHPGMTLRDYFAAKAMQALMTGGNDNAIRAIEKYLGTKDEDVVLAKLQVLLAENAYAIADAMLVARKATQ